MGSIQTFRGVTIDAGASWSSDYARGCDVTVSNDGMTWSAPIPSGTGTAQILAITFASQTARYVRVAINARGTGTSHWWSIDEFNVLN